MWTGMVLLDLKLQASVKNRFLPPGPPARAATSGCWENGCAERAGAEWKRQFKQAIRKGVPMDNDKYVTLGQM